MSDESSKPNESVTAPVTVTYTYCVPVHEWRYCPHCGKPLTMPYWLPCYPVVTSSPPDNTGGTG